MVAIDIGVTLGSYPPAGGAIGWDISLSMFPLWLTSANWFILCWAAALFIRLLWPECCRIEHIYSCKSTKWQRVCEQNSNYSQIEDPWTAPEIIISNAYQYCRHGKQLAAILALASGCSRAAAVMVLTFFVVRFWQLRFWYSCASAWMPANFSPAPQLKVIPLTNYVSYRINIFMQWLITIIAYESNQK